MPLKLRRRLQKFYRRATYSRRMRQPAAIILIYHRICQLTHDPQLLAVSPENFSAHLDILHRYYHPMGLLPFLEALRTRSLPDRTVVITFDDGYRDNLTEAYPLLAAMGIPATVFIASGYVGTDREFWWDDVERILLLNTHQTPEMLSITAGNAAFSAATQTAEQRKQAYHNLLPWMRARTPAELEAIRDILQQWAQLGSQARPSHAIMSRDEVRALASSGLVEIGAHTRLHPSLASLTVNEQQMEIVGGKRELENILGTPVHSFSYPFGTRADYSRQTMAIVRRAGFACGIANWPDSIRAGADPWQLPRRLVRNWPGEEFAAYIQNFFLPAE